MRYVYTDEQLQIVANAIIVQAADDYRNALRGKGCDGKTPNRVKRECERFFRSDYFTILTKVSGEYLIDKLRNEVQNENHFDTGNTGTD